MALSRARRPAYCFVILRRRLFFSIELFFAILNSYCPRLRADKPSLPEREIERSEQRTRFFVRARRRAYGDVHAPNFGRLVVVDLGENNVFLHAERVITAAVETLGRKSAEIAHAWQRDVHQPVHEL